MRGAPEHASGYSGRGRHTDLMDHATNQLQRIGLKLFIDDPAGIEPRAVVPIFHRWIQTHAIDQLLIDVADYDHLPEGPRVVLVAHEGNFALDNSGGHLGLQYVRKQPMDGPLPARLRALFDTLAHAARLLEEDPSLAGRLRFRGEELEVVANDRLLAPNAAEAFDTVQAALAPLLAQLYPGETCTITRTPDPLERLTLTSLAPDSVSLTTLISRLAG